MEQPDDILGEVTRIFAQATEGGADAVDEALPLLYDELRQIAGAYVSRERVAGSLQPTLLAHEAFLRLRSRTSVRWKSRSHFLAAAAQAMRRILVDRARARLALKRGGDLERVEFDETIAGRGDASWVELMSLDRSLTKLADEYPRKARVVELLFFGGMTPPEAAEILEITRRTVERDWHFARAWLLREMSEDP